MIPRNEQTLSYIEDMIQNALKKTKDNGLIDALNGLSEFLAISNDGKDFDKIEQALLYLQSLPVSTGKGFFSKFTTIGDDIRKKGNPIFTQDTTFESLPQDQSAQANLSKQAVKEIEHIHTALMDYYKNNYKQEYAYVKNESGEVMNDIVGEWQEKRVDLAETQAVKVDFNRGYRIMDETSANAEDAGKKINQFVGQGKDYSDEDKHLVEEWIRHNGGQENERVLDFALMGKHISNGKKGKDIENVATATSEGNWTLENGKFCLTINVNYYGIGTEDRGGMILDKQNNLLFLDSEKYFDLMDIFRKKPHVKVQYPPLLNAHLRIELEIASENGKRYVKPKIMDFDFISHTNHLFSNNENLVKKGMEPQARPILKS